MSEGVRQRFGGDKSDKKESTKSKSLSEDEAVQKASGGWIRAILISLVLTVTVPLVILIVLPCRIDPQPMKMQAPPEMVGPLAPNNLLKHSEQIFKGQVEGPESIEVHGDHIYTGTADGWVIDIHEGQIKKLVQFGGPPCGGFENENTCGRPLGMRIGQDGFLYVTDSYFGLYKVNVQTGDYTTLLSSKTPVNGVVLKIFNDLDIGADGKIYFTSSSDKWNRNQVTNAIFEYLPSGRVLVYDPVTAEVKQLMDGIGFANGIQLTSDKKSLLICDTINARVFRYNIETGKATIWADNLPGLPDNIRYCKSSGTYWIGFSMFRDKKLTSIDGLAPYPWVRGVLSKVLTIGNVEAITKVTGSSGRGIAAEMSEAGKIMRTLQDDDGSVIAHASQVTCDGGILYFGSFSCEHIGRLDMKKAGL